MNQVEFAEKFWTILVSDSEIIIRKRQDQHSYMRNIWAYDILEEACSNKFLIKCILNEFDSEFCDKLCEHIADRLIWTNEDYIIEREKLESE